MMFVMLAFAQSDKANLSTIEEASAAALERGDYQKVMALSEQGLVADSNNAWLLYDRGAAMASLGRLDEAVTTLARAQAAFPADQPWGRALASYRRGLALARLGRCNEAQVALAKYTTLMKQLDRDVAAEAQRDVGECERQMVRGRSKE